MLVLESGSCPAALMIMIIYPLIMLKPAKDFSVLFFPAHFD